MLVESVIISIFVFYISDNFYLKSFFFQTKYKLLVCTPCETSRLLITVLVVRYGGNRNFEHSYLIFAQMPQFPDRSAARGKY